MYAEPAPWSGGYLLPLLKDGLSAKAKPEIKVAALKAVTSFAEKHPESTALEIEWIVFPLSLLMNEAKKNVKDAAKAAMTVVASCSGNKDLEKFSATIVKAMEAAKNVPDCVEELAGCVFVQNVEAPALAVITPVLVRGLNERSEQTKRRCCVIVDNMCKLIDDPREGTPLLAEVKSLVAKCADAMSDPDAREMAEKANQSILKLADSSPFIEQNFVEFAGKSDLSCDGLDEVQIAFCSKVAFQLLKAKNAVKAGEGFAIMGLDAVQAEKMVQMMSDIGGSDEVEFVDDDV